MPQVAQVEFLKKKWSEEKNSNLDPNELAVNSSALANWVCQNCGYEWRAQINRVYNSSGKCPACEERNAIAPGVTDVLTLVPQAKEYYCYEKNENIDITHLGVGSSTEVWWRCPCCGNERKCAIKNKVKKNGDGTYSIRTCNKCFGKPNNGSRLTNNHRQKKQFVSNNANIMKFWDWEQNKDLDPSTITSYSRKQFTMTCPKCSYSWISCASYLRGYKGTCPCCDERRVIILGVNDVFTLVPGLIEYYDFDKNKDVDIKTLTISSKRKVYWKCPQCQEETYTSLTAKIRKANKKYVFNKCKRCHGKGIESALTKNDEIDFDIQDSQNKLYSDYGERSLAALYPQVAANWSPNNQRPANSVLPDLVSVALWKCSSCHFDYTAKVCDVVNGYAECPVCNNRRVQPGYNTVEDVYPDLAKRWSSKNHLKANEVLATSSYNALWICNSCGGEHRAPVKDMAAGIADCPFCNKRESIPWEKSLAAVRPEVVAMWSPSNDRTADSVLVTSWYFASWVCKECGGEYNATVKDVVDGTADCPFCNGRKALPGFNSLADTHPDIAAMWSTNNERTADSIFATSWFPVSWICPECKGEYNALVKDVVDGTADCPFCNGRKALPGFNSLVVQFPNIVLEWDTVKNYAIGMDPDSILPTNITPVWWICEKGHKYRMSTKNRVLANKRHQVACGCCKGRRRERRHFV